jgi:hypothetical protein
MINDFPYQLVELLLYSQKQQKLLLPPPPQQLLLLLSYHFQEMLSSIHVYYPSMMSD